MTDNAVRQWDHCLSTLLIRSTLGASFGVIFSVLLFKRRAWPALVGLGFGAGRAWEECDAVCDAYMRNARYTNNSGAELQAIGHTSARWSPDATTLIDQKGHEEWSR